MKSRYRSTPAGQKRKSKAGVCRNADSYRHRITPRRDKLRLYYSGRLMGFTQNKLNATPELPVQPAQRWKARNYPWYAFVYGSSIIQGQLADALG